MSFRQAHREASPHAHSPTLREYLSLREKREAGDISA